MWDKIKALALGALYAFWGFFKPIAKRAALEGAEIIRDLVAEAAEQAERTDKKGLEKLEYATEYVWKNGKERFGSQMERITTVTIHGLIIAAVAEMQERLGGK